MEGASSSSSSRSSADQRIGVGGSQGAGTQTPDSTLTLCLTHALRTVLLCRSPFLDNRRCFNRGRQAGWDGRTGKGRGSSPDVRNSINSPSQGIKGGGTGYQLGRREHRTPT